mmetsp:Transcript_14801/g.19416  ORF Transcript_14801/g.19416 Transcript_14801/m.19416 type:complete len:306 (-) Transcript_14801:110-1027(-)
MAAVKRISFGSLQAYEVTNEAGASVKVSLYGATIYSYSDSNGRERLFLSDKAVTDGSKPIRGGVPLVFPKFGDGQGKYPELPSHGFARRSLWTFQGESKTGEASESAFLNPDGTVTFFITLSSSPEILSNWNYPFKLTLKVTFGSVSLATELIVENTGTETFEFQALLHTYYLLSSVETIGVQGLKGLTYIDQLQDGMKVLEDNEEVQIKRETDWIYTNAASPVQISGVDNNSVKIDLQLKQGNDIRPVDAVLWNPWVEKSKRMSDFGDEEYHRMLCLEPGCVSRFEKCAPGQVWSLEQRITFPL